MTSVRAVFVFFSALVCAADVFAGRKGPSDSAVYGISHPAGFSAALQLRWPDAGRRVPMWEMPRHTEDYYAYFREKEMFLADPTNRCRSFETACRRVIGLNIVPALFNYDLACALALQKKTDEAVSALERAVVAGYDDARQMQTDADLASLGDDPRYKRLIDYVSARGVTGWNAPAEHASFFAGKLRLESDTVFYDFTERVFCSIVDGASTETVLCLDRDDCGESVLSGTVPVRYAPDAVANGFHRGVPNIWFADARHDGYLPAVARFSAAKDERGTIAPAAWIAQNGGCEGPFDSSRLAIRNVLGVYAAGEHFTDDADAFKANPTWFLSHAGGESEGRAFMQMAVDVIRALPEKTRLDANRDGMTALTVLHLIRGAQRHVGTCEDFLKGETHRAAVCADDIDRARLLASASRLDEYPLPSPAVVCTGGDRRKPLTRCPLACAYEIPASTNVFRARLRSILVDYARPVWRVLQGDPSTVSLTVTGEKGDGAEIVVSSRLPFDAPRAGGGMRKTSRVDIGCFAVSADGAVSLPAVCSFTFAPLPPEQEGRASARPAQDAPAVTPPEKPKAAVVARPAQDAPAAAPPEKPKAAVVARPAQNAPAAAPPEKPKVAVAARPVEDMPTTWCALLEEISTNLVSRGYRPEGVLDAWRIQRLSPAEIAAAAKTLGKGGIRGMRMKITDLPPALKADLPPDLSDDVRAVQVVLCDFTGDGLRDLVAEIGGSFSTNGCTYGFYVRRKEGGYRRLQDPLPVSGLCPLPRGSAGPAAFLRVRRETGNKLAFSLVEWRGDACAETPLFDSPRPVADMRNCPLRISLSPASRCRAGVFSRPLFWPWRR